MAKKCEHDRQSCAICSPEKVFHQYAYKAKARNLSFSITLQEFEALVNARCYWCGKYESNGIDRLDPRVGYVQSPSIKNCVPCCWRCNRARGVLSEYEWTDLIFTVARNLEKRNKAKLAEKKPEPVAA